MPSADLTGRGFSEVRDNIASSRGTMYVISDGGKVCEVVVKVPIRIDCGESSELYRLVRPKLTLLKMRLEFSVFNNSLVFTDSFA